MAQNNEIKVWDLVVRFFHWTLVISFLVAYITEDDFLSLHVYAGYVIGTLILVRLIWGFIGTRHARFSDFVFAPGRIIEYLRDVVLLRARRFIGHNPAGGAMTIALLVSLSLTVFTGLALYAAGEGAGPLNSLISTSPRFEDFFEEIHEFFANLSVLLVAIHVLGVIVESVLHRENLVRAMINGRKKSDPHS